MILRKKNGGGSMRAALMRGKGGSPSPFPIPSRSSEGHESGHSWTSLSVKSRVPTVILQSQLGEGGGGGLDDAAAEEFIAVVPGGELAGGNAPLGLFKEDI